ncbi:MAG: oligoribonuclease [Candidatus Babeliales bacterium]
MQLKDNLVWIDLEMTGLDPYEDQILEIATIITDKNLTIVAEGPNVIVHQPAQYVDRISDEVKKLFEPHGLLDEVRDSRITLYEAEQQTLEFIKKFCPEKKILLCGNSVWVDRNFLRRHMPKIDSYLHYRLIDVTTIKELAARWYPQLPEFKKKDSHRALDDIKESIAELRYYREHIFQ